MSDGWAADAEGATGLLFARIEIAAHGVLGVQEQDTNQTAQVPDGVVVVDPAGLKYIQREGPQAHSERVVRRGRYTVGNGPRSRRVGYLH